MKLITKFYNVCLFIIATSAINLSMTLYSIKQKQRIESKNLNQDLTVDQILKTPQTVSNLKETQMEKLERKDSINVAIIKDIAYWVENNTLYKVKLDEKGLIDIDLAEPVDVFSLSKKELDSLTQVVDSINRK